jgi:hypothetical protein
MTLLWIIAGLVVLFGLVAFFGAPYVPSLRREVRGAFDDLYPVKKGDVVVDLGSGDGLVLMEAAKRGAHCVGYEINPLLALLSKLRLGRRATISMRNMWTAELPKDVTLVYVFSVSRDSRRLGRYMQQQSDRLGRSIHIMTFGTGLKDFEPVRSLKAHTLYEIRPR